MAWVERYVDSASTGGNGTTNATSGASAAWATIAAAITGVGAGPATSPTRINVKAGTYANGGTTLDFSTSGAATAPVWWRGYKTTPGDQDANNAAVAGTDIPKVTFTTGQAYMSGTCQVFSNLDITGAASIETLYASSPILLLYRCRFTNTNASAFARAATIEARATCVACSFAATTTADMCCNTTFSPVSFLGCTFAGGIVGCGGSTTPLGYFGCLFDGQAGDAIKPDSGCPLTVINCSIYAPGGHGISIPATLTLCTIANNHFEDVNQASKYCVNNSSGTNTNMIRCVANSMRNCTQFSNGLGDFPLMFDNGALGSSGFTNAAGDDFSATTALRAIGFPGTFENLGAFRGYLDNGAVQRLETAGGGGGGGVSRRRLRGGLA